MSRDAQTLVTAHSDSKLRIWNHSSHECQRTLSGHETQVSAVDIDPDGNIITSGSYDATIKLWQMNNGCLIRTLNRASRLGLLFEV